MHVDYLFDKMNVYFLKYSMETDAQIAGENKRKYKYKFPPKVDEWSEFQSRQTHRKLYYITTTIGCTK